LVVAALPARSVTIDGEAVCCDNAGVAVFEKLHSGAYDGEAFLYAFDLLELDGEDWRSRPLCAWWWLVDIAAASKVQPHVSGMACYMDWETDLAAWANKVFCEY
jgi:hypothetical protein